MRTQSNRLHKLLAPRVGTELSDLAAALHGDDVHGDQQLGELLGALAEMNGDDVHGEHDIAGELGALLGARRRRPDQLPPAWQKSLSAIIADYQKMQALRNRFPPDALERLQYVLSRPKHIAAQPATVPSTPGINSPAEGVITLGFPQRIFTAASGTALVATTLPQRPGTLKRLIADVRYTGTSGGLVTVTDIKIGTTSALMSGDPLPISMFGAQVLDSQLKPVPFSVGMTVEIFLNISAPPAGADTVAVGFGAYCKTIVS